MFHSELNQLARAEELFDEGKLDEALELLNDRNQFEGLNFKQKSYFQLLKGLILLYQSKFEELIKFGEGISKEGQKLIRNHQMVDGYFFIACGLIHTYKFDDASKAIEKAEELLKLNTKFFQNSLKQRKTRIKVLKAFIYLEQNNLDLTEKCLEEPLSLEKEPGITFEVVWANILMARVMYQGRSEFALALEYTKKALVLARKIKFNHFWIAFCQLAFGVVNLTITEFNVSLEWHLKSLAIYRKIKNNWFIAMAINNIGTIYDTIGDYELASKYYHESLSLFENQSIDIEVPLCNLIELALDNDDMKSAQEFFNRLDKLHNEKQEASVPLIYPLIKALMLKRSTRIRDIAKAEQILKDIIKERTVWFQVTISAYIHLCDLLLAEYRMNNSSEVLDEVNYYISKLLTIAEKRHSYDLLGKTFIFQAKLALMNFDMKAARQYLTQAQKIAESYGIKKLAIKISFEHDELLKQTKVWENLKESGASLSERWKFSGLSEQMENMVRKRMIALPKTSEENPVVILIIKEGGIPLFSHSFIEEKEFESPIFSGFLTTIDYFMKETFSEGLDRFIFGDYTLLMKSVEPFFICYVFEGDSYYAHQRIKYFIDNVQKEAIWQNLINLFQSNRSIHLKDIPLLESLITETFITKSIVFS